jgi:hypothetical protein
MNDILYTYTNEHSISPSLFCPICLEVLQEPHTHISCESAFCRSCLLQLTEPLCPICRWTWSESTPLDYNVYLPKANRLIRNMLDDLRVQCIRCHMIRRRGDFDHQCKTINTLTWIETSLSPSIEHMANSQTTLFVFMFIIWFTMIYYNRMNLFEPIVDRSSIMIRHIASNIDCLLLDRFCLFVIQLLNYPTATLITHLCMWFNMKVAGQRYLSQETSRLFENIFETSIILNLIIYSCYN